LCEATKCYQVQGSIGPPFPSLNNPLVDDAVFTLIVFKSLHTSGMLTLGSLVPPTLLCSAKSSAISRKTSRTHFASPRTSPSTLRWLMTQSGSQTSASL